MKFEVADERNNIYLKRKELDVKIDHMGEATPMKAALQQLLAKQLNKDVEHIDIVNIFSDKGRALAASKVYVWDEKKAQDLSKVVKEKKVKAEEVKAEAKAETKREVKAAEAAKPAEAKPVAAPEKK